MSTCQRSLLAAHRSLTVEECACGTMHVTIGAVTLRVTPEVMAEVAGALREAMEVWRANQRRANARLGAAS
jgi:hypothetical protein